MGDNRFSEEQMVWRLRAADRDTVPEVVKCPKVGAHLVWQLEQKHSRPKQLLAERDLELQVLKQIGRKR